MKREAYDEVLDDLLNLAEVLGVLKEVRNLPPSIRWHTYFVPPYEGEIYGDLSIAKVFAWPRHPYPSRLAARLSWFHSWIWRNVRLQRIEELREEGEALEKWTTRHELEAWAAARGVSGWLDVEAFGHGSSELDRHWTFGDVLVRSGLWDLHTPRSERREGCRKQLLGLEKLAARAIASEDRNVWKTVDLDPRRAEAVESLLALRATYRAQTAPRNVPPTDSAIDIDKSGELRYVEYVNPICGDARGPAEVFLRRTLGGDWEVSCRCLWDCEKFCGVKLGAIDMALNHAIGVGPQNGKVGVKLRNKLSKEPWRDALDACLEAVAPPRLVADDSRELGWEVKFEPDGAQLYPVEVRSKRDGGVSITRIKRVDWEAVAQSARGIDAQLLGELIRCTNWRLHKHWEVVSPMLASLDGHPRVFTRGSGVEPLTVRAHRATSQVDISNGRVTLRPDFGDAPDLPQVRQFSLDDPGIWFESLDHASMTLHLFITPDSVATAVAVFRTLEWAPEAAHAELLDRLSPQIDAGAVTLSPAARGERRDAAARLALDLQLANEILDLRLRAVPIAGGPSFAAGEGPGVVYGVADGNRFWVERNLADERLRATEMVEALGLPPDHLEWEIPLGLEVVEFLERLAAVEARGELVVRWKSKALRSAGTFSGSAVKVQVGSFRDWLTIGGTAHIGKKTEVPLEQLMAAAREGRQWVEVKGGLARIEEKLRARLAGLSAEVSPFLAPVLLELEEEGASITGDSSWRDLADRMRQAARSTPATPTLLQATLRPYQREGFVWLSRLAQWAPGAVLADDMGLGKTLQALTVALSRRDEGPVLVVAPTSLGFNWQREATRFTPDLNVVLIRGGAELEQVREAGPGDLIITSYGLATRYADALADIGWGTIVYDEAQALKNPATQRAKAARQIEGKFTIALTGTPIENRSEELWSAFRVVVPGLLGGLADFRSRFANPIERNADAGAARALAMLVSPFVLRRLKREVARELPERIEARLDVELSPIERSVYDAYRVEVLRTLEVPDVERFEVLAALTRLRQLACDPGLVDATFTGPSSKISTLLERLEELRAEGQRALVFSQFTSLLDRVEPALEAAGLSFLRIDGATPAARRGALVDRFQAREVDVFLLSTKAGGQGLNLTAATAVFHLDPWWNPAVEDQATDRAHRIGQREPVTVYRLISIGTIEEAIYDLHRDKRALVDSLLEGAGSSRPLSPEQLRLLIESDGYEAPEATDPTIEERLAPRRDGNVIHLFGGDCRPSKDTAVLVQDEARRLVVECIAAAVEADEISAGTGSVYRPKAGRYIDYLCEEGFPLTPDGAAMALDQYVDELSSGVRTAPKSDLAMASAVARWVTRALATATDLRD